MVNFMDFCRWAWDICVVSLCQAVGPRGFLFFFFFCDPLPLLSWSLEQLRINYPPRNKRPLTLEKHTIPSSPQCKKKKCIGPLLFPCSFSPTNTMREKPLSSSWDAVIAPADIKNLHRSYAGIFCPRCKNMQSACLFVSSLSFAPLRVIFKLQPQCLDHSTNSVSHWQRQNGTKIVHYEKCAGVSTK